MQASMLVRHAVVAGAALLALGCTAELGEDVQTQTPPATSEFPSPTFTDGTDSTDAPPTPPPTPPPSTPDPSCVAGDLAYWRAAPVWPTASLEIAGVVYSEAQLRGILTLEGHADASITAAQELIVTLLNQCAGCAVPDDVQDAIDTCDDWFEDNVGWDFDGDGAIPYCIPPGDELADGLIECVPTLVEFNSSGS
jgi:hypothetical protein